MVYGDEFFLGMILVVLEEEVGGFDGGETRLSEACLAAVVEDDVGGAVFALISLDAADDSGGDFVGVDGLPVAGEEVPLDGGEAKLAGDAEDGGAAGSVGCAEVADGSAECVFVGVQFEGDDVDDGEESEEVAEDGDDLGVPETAHHGDAQDVAHG